MALAFALGDALAFPVGDATIGGPDTSTFGSGTVAEEDAKFREKLTFCTCCQSLLDSGSVSTYRDNSTNV